jgi:steroid 5-alpha reductase family enzyme
MEPNLVLPLVGLVATCAAMTWAWARQRGTRNAGIVDVLWTGSLGVLALAYGFGADGWLPRRVLVTVLAVGWSARLTIHLARRVGSEAEDGRYADLRERLGERFDRWMLGFFQAQALLAVLLSLTFLAVAAAPDAGWRVQDAIGVAIWVVALVGEGIADRQLAAWRADPANRGVTCRAGLWRYSRHPNYFFEWVHWLTYPVLGIGLPLGWALWATPALMLFLVLRVTGIPPTEAQSVRSRGDDYRAYQRTTNAFFPGPPRRPDTSSTPTSPSTRSTREVPSA